MTPVRPVMLFDLDGTLANTIPLILASYQYAFDQVLGRSVSPEIARGWIGLTLADTFASEGPEVATELERVYIEYNRSHIATHTRRYEGIETLLRQLRDAGVRLGVVTSKRLASATLTLEAVGLSDLIDIVATMESTQVHKPDGEPLRFAMRTMEVGTTDALYVGDAVVDLQAAANAGIPGVGVGWGAGEISQLRQQHAHAVVDSVSGLRGVLLGG